MTTFSVEQKGAVTCVGLPSRVDVTNAKHLVDLVRAEMAEGHVQLILDLSQTVTIDSTALGAIVQVFKKIREADGTLCMAAVGEGVRRVLAITRVDRIFPLFASVEEAVQFSSEHQAS